MKLFKCKNGHTFDIDFPDEFFSDGAIVVPCPKCNLRYKMSSKTNIEPFRHTDPLRFLAMQY